MRIAKTFAWRPRRECHCGLSECQRYYCPKHRLIYRSCDTIVKVTERASWEDGGDRSWIETTGDCPRCKDDAETERYRRWAENQNRGTTI